MNKIVAYIGESNNIGLTEGKEYNIMRISGTMLKHYYLIKNDIGEVVYYPNDLFSKTIRNEQPYEVYSDIPRVKGDRDFILLNINGGESREWDIDFDKIHLETQPTNSFDGVLGLFNGNSKHTKYEISDKESTKKDTYIKFIEMLNAPKDAEILLITNCRFGSYLLTLHSLLTLQFMFNNRLVGVDTLGTFDNIHVINSEELTPNEVILTYVRKDEIKFDLDIDLYKYIR